MSKKHSDVLTKQSPCLFCSDETLSRKVAEEGSVFAIEDQYPVTPGHVLILPKRHVSDYFLMTDEEHRDANILMHYLKEKLHKSDKAITSFNIGMNCGVDAGQTIFHAHIHLIPRRKGDVIDPRGGVRGCVPEKRVY